MKRTFWISGCLSVAVVFASGAVTRGDQVHLVDGSVLVGTMEGIADGKVTITTDFAGKLVIETAKVRSITSEGKVHVALKDGDRLVGPISPSADGTKSVVHSSLGPIEVSQEQMTTVWRDGQPSPEMVAVEAAKPKWTATVEAGLMGTEGNSDTFNGMVRAQATRKSADDLLTFYASADYAELDDVRNKHQVIGGARYEHSLPHKWENWGGPYFWFVRTELEYDEFEDLDLRATFAGGLGHYWIQKKHMDFTTRAGAGYRHEAFRDGQTKDDAILDLGYDFRYDIREWVRFTQNTVYSPSLEEFDEYRVTIDTALTFPLGTTDKWKFKTGVRKEYNSDPQPGIDNLDSTYYANIVAEIK